jgi:hypothetical protein
VPGQLGIVTQLEDGRETTVVTAAQFNCTLPEDQRGTVDTIGTLRSYDQLTLEELKPTLAAYASDDRPATILQLDLVGDASTGDVTAKLCAEDASGMKEVTVLRFLDDDLVPGGTGTVVEFGLDVSGSLCSDGAGNVIAPWEVTIPNGIDAHLRVNFVGNDGLLRVKGNKAQLLLVKPIVIHTSFISQGGPPTVLKVEIVGFDEVSPDAVLEINWGDTSPIQYVPLYNPDGTLASGVTVDANGDGVTLVEHSFPDGGGGFTIQVQLNASNATGFAEKTIPTCADPSGDSSIGSADYTTCSIQATGTGLLIGVSTVAEIDDENVQYRIRFPATGDQVKFSKNTCTSSLPGQCTVTRIGNNGLEFDFEAGGIWDGVSQLDLYMQSQSGVAGSPTEGIPDRMPDAGEFSL